MAAFFQGRRAVVLGTAFDDVGDVDVVPREADAPQGLVQELPRRADQGNAVFIFHTARSFADEHQRRRAVAGIARRPAVAFIPQVTGRTAHEPCQPILHLFIFFHNTPSFCTC